jgi:lipopolysaccharide transport system permease protein
MTNLGTDYTNERIIKPIPSWRKIDFRELWAYRELLVMLIIRDVQGKYRQSALGFLWAIIPPVVQMVVFTIIFGRVAKLGPDNIPYPVFSFAALLPWTYFSRALTTSGGSLIGKKNLLTKVYFPRLILPLTGVFGVLFDFAIAFLIMIGLLFWYSIVPGWEIVFLPIFIIIAMLTALGVGLWLTSLSVKYRDVAFVTPFFVQIWMYVSPVIFSIDKIPEKYHLLLWLNPMTGVIEGFRWVLLNQTPPDWSMMCFSLLINVFVLITGLFYFKRMEKTFADII